MADQNSSPQVSAGSDGPSPEDMIAIALEKALAAIAAEPVPEDLRQSAEALDQALCPDRTIPGAPEQP